MSFVGGSILKGQFGFQYVSFHCVISLFTFYHHILSVVKTIINCDDLRYNIADCLELFKEMFAIFFFTSTS